MDSISNLRPTGNRLLVKLVPPETVTKQGIILPESNKAKQNIAVVVALGYGYKEINGLWLPWPVQVGNTVLLAKYAGIEVGDEHLIVTSDDVVAIMVEG
jgi:chaperonin GroES